jgi:hypothetical protein
VADVGDDAVVVGVAVADGAGVDVVDVGLRGGCVATGSGGAMVVEVTTAGGGGSGGDGGGACGGGATA